MWEFKTWIRQYAGWKAVLEGSPDWIVSRSARKKANAIYHLSLARETQQLRAVFPANLTENLRF